jgi:hypothetical protein
MCSFIGSPPNGIINPRSGFLGFLGSSPSGIINPRSCIIGLLPSGIIGPPSGFIGPPKDIVTSLDGCGSTNGLVSPQPSGIVSDASTSTAQEQADYDDKCCTSHLRLSLFDLGDAYVSFCTIVPTSVKAFRDCYLDTRGPSYSM